VQAITMKAPVGKRIAVAVMDADICIRCYCCHELCPENAIDLCRGRLGRLLIH
jgi:Pyruvate/2-oxoacid:ferredoxin oxidoreductase delta subunit